jgi:hypothetical protein
VVNRLGGLALEIHGERSDFTFSTSSSSLDLLLFLHPPEVEVSRASWASVFVKLHPCQFAEDIHGMAPLGGASLEFNTKHNRCVDPRCQHTPAGPNIIHHLSGKSRKPSRMVAGAMADKTTHG